MHDLSIDRQVANGWRPLLIYKAACPPCRWMSRLVVLGSAGLVVRVPLDGVRAKAVYRAYPDREGELVLLQPSGPIFGRRVFAMLPIAVAAALMRGVAVVIRGVLATRSAAGARR
jgi:hypothetical protein